MPELFIGESDLRVDAKGRVSIPALFRRVLDQGDPDRDKDTRPRVYIAYGDTTKPFLECYTHTDYMRISGRIMALPDGSPGRRLLESVFLRRTFYTELDPEGRLVVPQKVRDRKAIQCSSTVIFAGAGDKFQIWNEADYEAANDANDTAQIQALGGDVDLMQLLNLGGALPGQVAPAAGNET